MQCLAQATQKGSMLSDLECLGYRVCKGNGLSEYCTVQGKVIWIPGNSVVGSTDTQCKHVNSRGEHWKYRLVCHVQDCSTCYREFQLQWQDNTNSTKLLWCMLSKSGARQQVWQCHLPFTKEPVQPIHIVNEWHSAHCEYWVVRKSNEHFSL